MTDPIFVTRPDLPELSELIPMLEEIWETRWVTNRGPFHEKFEEELRKFAEAPAASLVCNGTAALDAAITAADLEGEVITTPYTFVATIASLVRFDLTPVFVDIQEHDLNIDADQIEAAITPRTSAIMGVHVYGNPCSVDAIDRIAQKHGLKVIYDGAHCFGGRLRGKPLVDFGDFTTLSFHGTKVFNTFEGGAVICRTEDGKRRVDLYRNFGIESELDITAVGTNAKMSEFNAALGLLQLKRYEMVKNKRGEVDRRYREALRNSNAIKPIDIPADLEPNYSYFPIIVDPASGVTRDIIYDKLREQDIYSRKYFYPLLADLEMFKPFVTRELPVARRMSDTILCLPIYPDLEESEQARILDVITSLG